MRRLVAIGAIAIAALAASATSSAVTPPARVVCGGGSTTVLFWPQGHAAIPSVNFPAFGPPHIEVYKSGARYPNADFRGYVGPGAGSWGQQCRPTSGVPSPSRVKKAKKLTTAAALVCRLKSPAINLERVDSAGKSTLKIFVGSALYVAAVIQAQGSFVTYNATLCTPKPSPS